MTILSNEQQVMWVLIDLSNSNPRSKNYLWWFETRKLALAHRKRQNAIKNGARLGPPQKWFRDAYQDWSLLEATQESLREHMAQIKDDKALLRQALDALLYAADHTEPASLDCKCPICETIEALEDRLRGKQ